MRNLAFIHVQFNLYFQHGSTAYESCLLMKIQTYFKSHLTNPKGIDTSTRPIYKIVYSRKRYLKTIGARHLVMNLCLM